MEANYEVTLSQEAAEAEKKTMDSESSRRFLILKPNVVPYLCIQLIRGSIVISNTIKKQKISYRKSYPSTHYQEAMNYLKYLLIDRPIVKCFRFRSISNKNPSEQYLQFFKILKTRFLEKLDSALMEIEGINAKKAIFHHSDDVSRILKNLNPRHLKSVIFKKSEPYLPGEVGVISDMIRGLEWKVSSKRIWISDLQTGLVDYGKWVNFRRFEMVLEHIDKEQVEVLIEHITNSKKFKSATIILPSNWTDEEVAVIFESLQWKIDYSNGDIRLNIDMTDKYYLKVKVFENIVFLERRLEVDRDY